VHSAILSSIKDLTSLFSNYHDEVLVCLSISFSFSVLSHMHVYQTALCQVAIPLQITCLILQTSYEMYYLPGDYLLPEKA
jgi:hypothetical protein